MPVPFMRGQLTPAVAKTRSAFTTNEELRKLENSKEFKFWLHRKRQVLPLGAGFVLLMAGCLLGMGGAPLLTNHASCVCQEQAAPERTPEQAVKDATTELQCFSKVASMKESEPAPPEELKPALPEESEPALPEESEPARPEESEPARPEESEPAPPKESEPTPPKESKPVPLEKSEPAPPEESEPTPPEESKPAPPEKSEPAPPDPKKEPATVDLQEKHEEVPKDSDDVSPTDQIEDHTTSSMTSDDKAKLDEEAASDTTVPVLAILTLVLLVLWRKASGEVRRLRQNLGTTRKSLEQQNTEANQSIRELKQSLSKKQQEVLIAKSNAEGVNILGRRLEEADAEREKLKSTMSAKETQLKEAAAQVARLDEVAQRKSGEVLKLGGELEGKHEEVATLKGELNEKCEEVASLKGDLKSLQGDLEGKCEEVNTLQGDLEVKCEEVTTLKGDLMVKCEEVATLKGDLEEKCEEVSTLEVKLKGKCEEVSTLEVELKGKCEEVGDLTEAVQTKAVRIQELQGALEEKFSEIENLQKEVEFHKDQNWHLQAQANSLDSDLQTMRENMRDLERAVDFAEVERARPN